MLYDVLTYTSRLSIFRIHMSEARRFPNAYSKGNALPEYTYHKGKHLPNAYGKGKVPPECI